MATAALDPSFFEGRYMIEIAQWDWKLHVSLNPDTAPPEERFQGALSYTRTFEIEGRVIAPKAHREQTIRISLSPFGPDVRFGPHDVDEVGELQFHRPQLNGRDLSVSLMLPESAIPVTATCLASVWKYLDIWTFDADSEKARIAAFAFSSTIHKNLESWVRGD